MTTTAITPVEFGRIDREQIKIRCSDEDNSFGCRNNSKDGTNIRQPGGQFSSVRSVSMLIPASIATMKFGQQHRYQRALAEQQWKMGAMEIVR